MLATGLATGAGKAIDIRNRIQVGKWILQDWAAIIETYYLSLVEITQTVHLAAPIPDVCSRNHCIPRQLHFRAETRLLDVT